MAQSTVAAARSTRALGLLTAGIGLLAALIGGLAGPAGAAISTPGAGSTVRGNVAIHENRGGHDEWPCGSADSWIEVYNPSGSRIVSAAKGDAGSWTYTWNTHGQPRGTYRLRSLTRDSDLTWSGCRSTSTSVRSDFTVHLDNLSSITSSNASTFAGERVALGARLTDRSTGRAIAGRTVTFTVAGQRVSDATDGAGNASALSPAAVPAGTHTVQVAFADDSAWRGSATTAMLVVQQRPTAVAITGATEATFGDTVTVAAALSDTRAGAPVSGAELTFTLERDGEIVRSASASTAADGVASAPLTLDVKGGGYTLHAAFAGDTDRTASSASTEFTVHKLASVTTYGGDTEAFWNEDATVTAQVADAHGNALSTGTVTFSTGGESVTADVVDGVAAATLTAAAEPGTHLLQAVFSGDDSYQPSSTLAEFTVKQRPTVLAYDGDLGGLYGATSQLSATLTDERAEHGVAGRAVRFQLGDWFDQTASTDADGRAVVSVELAGQNPGAYPLRVSFAGDRHYVASETTTTFTLGWQHVFADADGAGRVYLNPATRQFMVEGPNGTSGIKHDADMRIVGAPTRLAVPSAPEPPEAPQPPDAPSLPDVPTLPEPGEPQPPTPPAPPAAPSLPDCDPMFYLPGCLPSARASAVAHEGETPQLPTPELPALPADVSVCDVAVDSQCEARWVGIAFGDDELTMVGWFDLWSGAFVAVVRTDAGLLRLASTAGCETGLVDCVALPGAGLAIPSALAR